MPLLFLLCALPLWSQSAQQTKPRSRGNQEIRMLQNMLKMTDADLSALRKTIERIESMDTKEKERMRGRIGELEQMPPERVDALRERFKAIDPETRAAMRKRWMQMEPEIQRDWRDRLRNMTPEERVDILKKHGILPTPSKRPNGSNAPKAKS